MHRFRIPDAVGPTLLRKGVCSPGGYVPGGLCSVSGANLECPAGLPVTIPSCDKGQPGVSSNFTLSSESVTKQMSTSDHFPSELESKGGRSVSPHPWLRPEIQSGASWKQIISTNKFPTREERLAAYERMAERSRCSSGATTGSCSEGECEPFFCPVAEEKSSCEDWYSVGCKRCCTALSGSHGEWTNEDDMPRNKRARTIRKAVQAVRTVGGRLANQFIEAQTGINLNKLARSSRNSRHITAPVASMDKMGTRSPNISMNNQSVRIRHREFVGDVTCRTTFTLEQDLLLNPADSFTFPWLSTQAASWEKYRFRSLRFEFVTRSATSTVGQLIMVPLYDAKEQPPTTEASATTYAGTVEGPVWSNLMCSYSPAKLGDVRFVNTTVQAGDIRTSNAGRLAVYTTNASSAANIGKLWVEYDVEMYIPMTIAPTPACSAVSQYWFATDQTAFSVTWTSYTNGRTTVHDGLELDRSLAASASSWRLPRGSYLIILRMEWLHSNVNKRVVSIMFSSSTAATDGCTTGTFTSTAVSDPHTMTHYQIINTAGGVDYYPMIYSDNGDVYMKGDSSVTYPSTVTIMPV